jgi:hypothetical protein
LNQADSSTRKSAFTQLPAHSTRAAQLTNPSLDQPEYEANIKSYAWKERRDDRGFSLDFELSHSKSMAFNFSEWLKSNGEGSNSATATLIGKSGRRLQLRKPEAFLAEQVLTQPKVQEWVRTHASICFKSKLGRQKWKCPEIWLCTDVQLVTGGDVQIGNSKSSKVGGGAGGDPGPLFGAPPGVAKVGVEGSYEHSESIGNDFGYDDERVWAAQFMEVTIEYGSEEDAALTFKENRAIPKTVLKFGLKQIEDLAARGIRSGTGEDPSAEMMPNLIGRVTVTGSDNVMEEESDGDCPDIVLNDVPYVSAAQDVHWEMYKEYSLYLAQAAARRRSQSPETARQ